MRCCFGFSGMTLYDLSVCFVCISNDEIMQESTTQCVSQACLHTGCVHMADATLIFWFHKHSQPHIPEGLHCHLQDIVQHYSKLQFARLIHSIADFSRFDQFLRLSNQNYPYDICFVLFQILHLHFFLSRCKRNSLKILIQWGKL